MAGKSQLFGQIAKRYGFVTELQVQEALDRQDRYLSAHVQKPIGEILKEMGLLTDRRIARVLRAQGIRRERSASKDVGHFAVEEGLATQAQIEECLALQEKRFREAKKMWSLADLLYERKYIDRRGQRTLQRARMRMEQGQTDRVTTIAYGVKECGNCFEMASLEAKQCPKCGSTFGEADLAIRCAKCGAPSAEGGEFCAKCGANVVTGETFPHSEPGRCPSCGRIMSPAQRICFQCGFLRPLPLVERVSRSLSRGFTLVLGAGMPLFAILAVIVVAIVAIRFWPRMRKTSSALAYGEMESRLHDEAESVRKAILYQDYTTVRKALSARSALSDDELLSALSGVKGVPIEVVSCDIAEYHAEEAEASAYVDLELKCRDEPPPHEKAGNPWADLEQALGGALSKGKQFAKKTTWRFRRAGDEWRLEAP